MIDINIIKINKINFNLKKTNTYIKYNDKQLEFYVNDTINITPVSSFKNKYNIIIKIDEKTKNIIEEIENKFLNDNNIKKENYIPIIKQNDKGYVIKLKIMSRYKKVLINCFDEDKEPILYSDIEKFTKIKCHIHICNFWNFNGKYGLLIYAKKINKLR